MNKWLEVHHTSCQISAAKYFVDLDYIEIQQNGISHDVSVLYSPVFKVRKWLNIPDKDMKWYGWYWWQLVTTWFWDQAFYRIENL